MHGYFIDREVFLPPVRSQREEDFLFSPPLFLTLLALLYLKLLTASLSPFLSHPTFLSPTVSLSPHPSHHTSPSTFLFIVSLPTTLSLHFSLCSAPHWLQLYFFPSSNSSRKLALGLKNTLLHLFSFQFLPCCQKRLQKRQIRRLKNTFMITSQKNFMICNDSYAYIQKEKVLIPCKCFPRMTKFPTICFCLRVRGQTGADGSKGGGDAKLLLVAVMEEGSY